MVGDLIIPSHVLLLLLMIDSSILSQINNPYCRCSNPINPICRSYETPPQGWVKPSKWHVYRLSTGAGFRYHPQYVENCFSLGPSFKVETLYNVWLCLKGSGLSFG